MNYASKYGNSTDLDLETLKARVRELRAVYQNSCSRASMEKSTVSLDAAVLEEPYISVLINFLNSGVTLQPHVMDTIYLLKKKRCLFCIHSVHITESKFQVRQRGIIMRMSLFTIVYQLLSSALLHGR